jgi:hypothetical protein
MRPNEIIEGVKELPIIPLGIVPDDGEIWEYTDGGAHFKVTRHTLPVPGDPEIVSLSVSGENEERERIITEFTEVFGDPADRDVSPISILHTDILMWLTNNIDTGKNGR